MKLFSVDEANALLPGLSIQLTELASAYTALEQKKKAAVLAAGAASAGGGMAGGGAYVELLYSIAKLTTDIEGKGIQIKDPRSGLIDFPSKRDDRIVLLCWRLGEDDELEYWHELDAGFAGRQRI